MKMCLIQTDKYMITYLVLVSKGGTTWADRNEVVAIGMTNSQDIASM